MDLEIIHSTKGKAGLDEVMKAMYDEYFVKQKRGFTDKEFKTMAEKIAGHSLTDIYDNYINGLKTIDYNKYLDYAGLSLKDDAAQNTEPYLGIVTSLREGKMIIAQVARGSGAWNDGLNVNDEMVSIDNYVIKKTSAGSLDMLKYIAGQRVGDKVKVSVIRDGLEKVIDVSLSRNPIVKYNILAVEEPSSAQTDVKKRWLK
jgi:predicted metalloprotease with PDZ domain